MTIASTNTRNDYIGTNATAVYAFTFPVSLASDLSLKEIDTANAVTDLVLGVDYTVDMDLAEITLTAGNLATGYGLSIQRVIPLNQQASIRNQGAYYPAIHEDVFDRLTQIDQQQQSQIDRSIKAAFTDDSTLDMTLPPAADRASKLLSFDSLGRPMAYAGSVPGAVSVSAFMETLLDDADAAAARVTLGGLATLTGSEVLSGKTLTTPILNTPLVNGIRLAVVASKTGDYTAAVTDYYIPFNVSGAAKALTLPAGVAGQAFLVHKTDTSFNAVTIKDASAVTVTTLNTKDEKVLLIYDGVSAWIIATRIIPSQWLAVPSAFTGSWVSNTTYTTFYKRIGDSVLLDGKLALAGAPTAAILTITLTGLTIDTTKLSVIDNTKVFGIASVWDNSANSYWQIWPSYNSSTTILIARTDDDATGIGYGSINATNPIIFAINDFITYRTEAIPISGWNS